jgi:glutathione S-transferase
MPEAVKDTFRAKIAKRFDWIVQQLGDKPYLMGADFSVADAYLFTVAGWTKYTGIDLARWPVLQAYLGRIAARPEVHHAMKEEGLVK